MHSIGLTELAHVNIELYPEPFHSFHGYSDYVTLRV